MVGNAHMDSITLFDKVVLQSALAWSAGLILPSSTLGGGPIKFLSQGWMFVISKLSYTWYLMHLMFLPWSLTLTADLLGDTETIGNKVAFIACLIIYGSISFFAAAALHYLVEQPLIDLRDHRSRRRVNPRPTQTAPTPELVGATGSDQ